MSNSKYKKYALGLVKINIKMTKVFKCNFPKPFESAMCMYEE